MTCFPCLDWEGTICFVVVSQRSPATPPSILLASDTFPVDSGWKPSPVAGPVMLSFNMKNRFDELCNIASL